MQKARRSGSGCIIEGKRILTNAHVVSDNNYIEIKRAGETKKYQAEVEIIGHDCDLAILKVEDEIFFKGSVPLEIGNLPKVGEKINVYGFPEGGEELCVTAGIVSRIEHNRYTHSLENLLCCQIDAAINSGNSGGPVIKNDKILGIAFESGEGENIGYMVPSIIINHFLEDIKDKKYDGFPDLAISCQGMENPAIREKYGMNENQTGILVVDVYPYQPEIDILKSGDVILSIDDSIIGNDGTVEFRNRERTHCDYLIQRKYIGDYINLEIIRNNEKLSKKIKLTNSVGACDLIPNDQYGIAPTYYIIGGLVFEPLVFNYFYIRWSETESIPSNLMSYYRNGKPERDRKRIVILTRVLEDEINIGYSDYENSVISYVNGKKISDILDLVKAVEENKEKYHVFIDEYGNQIVLENNKVKERNKIIMDRYKINSDRSEDLKGI